MKNNLKILSLFLVVIILHSCTVDKPQSYFGKTTLNVNKYATFGAQDLLDMIESQKHTGLYAEINGEFILSDNLEAHIKTYKLVGIEKDIEAVKNLSPTEDTKEMINASLAVFNFIKSKYETDYLKITKMVNEKIDITIINKAIREFEEKNKPILNKKIETLYNIALPYAKANGIEVSFF